MLFKLYPLITMPDSETVINKSLSRLEDQIIGVRFPVGAGNFSLHQSVQTGSEAHPASYPMGTRDSFPGGRAAGA
jgi:CRISPR/Cas system CSM-associated protein Csm4 (group 5 of RAMP superfamily)